MGWLLYGPFVSAAALVTAIFAITFAIGVAGAIGYHMGTKR